MVGQELMVQENHELIKAVADVYRMEKELAKKKKELNEQLLNACEKYNVLGCDNDEMTVTYVPATTRKGFDQKAFQRDYPDLYPLYETETPVKANVRVKLK